MCSKQDLREVDVLASGTFAEALEMNEERPCRKYRGLP